MVDKQKTKINDSSRCVWFVQRCLNQKERGRLY